MTGTPVQIGVRISYEGDSLFFPEFTTREMVRSYSGVAAGNTSATGSQLISGPARPQTYIWAIGALRSKADCLLVDKIFKAWDLKRAEGGTPAILVEDNTFGDSLSTYAVFSTAPTFTYYSSATMAIDFALLEI